jgi:MscS family membrane protein
MRPRVRAVLLVFGLFAVCSLVAPPATAQLPGLSRPDPTPDPTPASSSAPEPEAPDSPRAAARAFLDLTTRKGDNQSAARYLVLPASSQANGPELARRLRAVLERHLDVHLDALSGVPEGNTQDGLPQGVDSLGNVPDGRGGQDPVFLVRVDRDARQEWAFSRQTVARIDDWYDALPDRWIRDRIPQPLQRYGPWSVMWWQWLAMPVLAAAALALGRVAAAFTRRVLRRIFRRTPTRWDERLLSATAPAYTLLFSVAAAAILLPWLGLRPAAHAAVRSLLVGLTSFGVFWMLWRAVDLWAAFMNERTWAAANPSARSVLSVTRNLVRVFVLVAGLVTTLAAFGYPVVTVLAGLGIGGIAIAFGAQKTIENLFGSIALAADQPFRVGDFVKIEDFMGHVERIGMRSTQVRTLDRTLITLPNGKLADMRIEDFAARDRIRFVTTVSLAYSTREEQLRRIVAAIEALMRATPKVWPEAVVSSFAGFGQYSLDVEVMCWFETQDFGEFRVLRQQVLFGIMRIVEEEGSRLALPARTLHLEGEKPSPPAGGSLPETNGS